MNMTLDSLRRAATPEEKMDLPVDPSTDGLMVIHDWRWKGLMDDSVAVGSNTDLLIKEVCAQRALVHELRNDRAADRDQKNLPEDPVA